MDTVIISHLKGVFPAAIVLPCTFREQCTVNAMGENLLFYLDDLKFDQLILSTGVSGRYRTKMAVGNPDN